MESMKTNGPDAEIDDNN
ncbi:MAG: hypothetical protein WA918_08105 [Erythrobacter sp.]